MTSLKIVEFRETLKNYIESVELPKEVKSMVLKELSQQAQKDAMDEVLIQLKEKEDGKA